jgi:hypothetical protein
LDMNMTTTEGTITVQSVGSGKQTLLKGPEVFVEAATQAQVMSTAGTADGAVNIYATAGGVMVSAAPGKFIDIGGTNASSNVKIHSAAANTADGAVKISTSDANGPIKIHSEEASVSVESKTTTNLTSGGNFSIANSSGQGGLVSVLADTTATVTGKTGVTVKASQSGNATLESSNATAIIRGPNVELGGTTTGTVKVVDNSAMTFGSNRYQTRAFHTADNVTSSNYGIGT